MALIAIDADNQAPLSGFYVSEREKSHKISLSAEQCWPTLAPLARAVDVVFFDADGGYDDQFPWPAGEPPVPIIALIESEAPDRIDWAMRQGLHAPLMKPITSAGVYGALLIACRALEARRELYFNCRRLDRAGARAPFLLRARWALRGEAMQRPRDYAIQRGGRCRPRVAGRQPCRPKLQIYLIGLFSCRGYLS
jgi:AmiR/NasT family two-component response regulator